MKPYDYKVGNCWVWRMSINPDRITTLRNMRRIDDELVEELAESIKKDGQLAPALVNRRIVTANGRKLIVYEQIAGYHRKLATKLIGRKLVCDVYDNLTAEEVCRKMLAENIHRDPDSTEWATSIYENYCYFRQENLGNGKRDIASYCRYSGLSASKVHNAVRFMENLTDEVADLVYDGKLSYGAAAELARIQDKDLQLRWAVNAIALGLTSSVVRSRVSNYLAEKRGQLPLGQLFSEPITVKQYRHLMDPKLQEAALTQQAWLSAILDLIESGLLPKRVIGSARAQGLIQLEGIVQRVREFYESDPTYLSEVKDESPEQEAV